MASTYKTSYINLPIKLKLKIKQILRTYDLLLCYTKPQLLLNRFRTY